MVIDGQICGLTVPSSMGLIMISSGYKETSVFMLLIYSTLQKGEVVYVLMTICVDYQYAA